MSDPASPGGTDGQIITVRLFAALRDAAGEATTTAAAGTSIAQLITMLEQRYGPRFAERLSVAAVMVDGRPADREDDRPLPAGAEIALLPPFAGGA